MTNLENGGSIQRNPEALNQSIPQALIFDFSWVLLHPKNREYNGKLNDLNRNHTGTDPLGPYHTSAFDDEFELNRELLEEIKRIKTHYHIPVYMFTTDIIQERPEVQNVLRPNLEKPEEDIFNRIFTAREMVDKGKVTTTDLDKAKTQASAFTYIAEEVHLPTETKLYIDDKLPNLKAAEEASAGFETYQYKREATMQESNEKLFQVLRQIFPAVQSNPYTN